MIFNMSVRYDEELRTQVEDGSDDPMGWIDKMETEDQSLIGGGEEKGMKVYMTSWFGGVLQATADCIDSDRGWFTAANGPVYVVVESVQNDDILLTLCYSKDHINSPNNRESFEPSIILPSDDFIKEVLKRAVEFESFVSEVNQELAAESGAYQGLREDIGAIQEKCNSI